MSAATRNDTLVARLRCWLLPYAHPRPKAHLSTLLQAEKRQKRAAGTVELDADRVGAPELEDGGLADVLASMHVLTGKEWAALAAHLNGTAARSSKAHETALYRARRKLRAAA